MRSPPIWAEAVQTGPTSLQIDGANNVFVAGHTSSLDFPTTSGAFRPLAPVPLWNQMPGLLMSRTHKAEFHGVWTVFTYYSTAHLHPSFTPTPGKSTPSRPLGLSGQTTTVITVLLNQVVAGSITVPVAEFGAPGIFRSRPGVSSQAAAVNEDGTLNGPSNPAARGSLVSVFGTGFGLAAPVCSTGGLNPHKPAPLAPDLAVFIADAQLDGLPVVYFPAAYAGTAPDQPCGLEQLTLAVPNDVSPGVYEFYPWSVMIRPGGDELVVPGRVGATISVK